MLDSSKCSLLYFPLFSQGAASPQGVSSDPLCSGVFTVVCVVSYAVVHDCFQHAV